MFVVMRVYRSRFSMVSGSEFGCLGFQNQARGVAKNSFHTCWDSVDFGVIFTCFFDGFESSCDDFWCVGDRLEI